MPMIDLTYVRGSLEHQALGRFADELVTALLRAEQAPDTPYLRDNTLVYLHELDPAAQSVGGRGPGAPRFRVEMTRADERPQGTARGRRAHRGLRRRRDRSRRRPSVSRLDVDS
jgi:hypothetical protein